MAANLPSCSAEPETSLPTFPQHHIHVNTDTGRQKNSKSYAVEESWNVMRDIITRLYQTEGKTLKEVKGIMERDYRFYATLRMFKTRVVRWGLDKKLKKDEVLLMLRLKRQRQAAGKDSSFKIRDQKIDWNRVEQYLKRRPDLESKRHKPSQHQSELDIICRTPSPIPSAVADTPCVPVLLDPTLHVDVQEDIMRIFGKYHNGAFESDVWVLQDTTLCKHGFFHAVQMLSSIGEAPKLLRQNQVAAGFHALRQGLRSLECALKIRCPRIYYSMLVAILNLKGHVRESAIRFIQRTHLEILGDQHPLSLFWGKITVLPHEHRLDAMRNIYAIVFQHLEGEGAHKSQHGLDVLRFRCQMLKLLKDMKGTEFQQIASIYTTVVADLISQGRYGLSCKVLLGLATAQLDAGKIEQAEKTLAQIGSLVETKSKGSTADQWLDKEPEAPCSTSAVCCRKARDEENKSAEMVYGYYKGLWEPWSKWSPAAAGTIVDTYRQAEEGELGSSKEWFNVLIAMS